MFVCMFVYACSATGMQYISCGRGTAFMTSPSRKAAAIGKATCAATQRSGS